MVVGVNVAAGVNVEVGLRVFVGIACVRAMMAVSVAARFADSAVCAMTVGRNSGGIGVGMGFEVGAAQPAKSARREAMKRRRFI
jgi:hypothetical protein